MTSSLYVRRHGKSDWAAPYGGDHERPLNDRGRRSAALVGRFLARISKGRSIREFVLGAMIVPSLMCFVWFTWAGGTAIDLTMTQVATGEIATVTDGEIFAAPDGDKIFAMTNYMLSPIAIGLAMDAKGPELSLWLSAAALVAVGAVFGWFAPETHRRHL